MKHLVKYSALLLLLMAAQQGAVFHEFSHVSGARSTDFKVDAVALADSKCGLCPAFAQVNTPAFGHSFRIPLLVRAARDLSTEPPSGLIDTAAPRPRSRGPPV
jgi:hypothetical protein